MSSLVEFPTDTYQETAFRNFDPNTANFTIDNARALMWTAQLAYENTTTIETVLQRLGFTSVVPFVKHKIGIAGSFETRGIIGERPTAIVLAFAGTDPAVWENLATDFNLRPRGAGDTHVGFQQAADGAQAEIDQAVHLSRQTGKPLFITGHSLGAALAVLAAQRADAAGTPPKAVYVFGMPRTGGEQFRTAYDGRLGQTTYRLVHGVDIVARVPMSGIGFRHVGRVLQCKSGEQFNSAAAFAALGADQPAFAQGLVDIFVGGFANLVSGALFQPKGLGTFGPLFRFLPPPIRDHLQDRYLTALGDDVIPP
jgi:predicted lipase